MQEKFKLAGYELFKKIENKPLSQLKGYEVRLLSTCSAYTDPDKIDSCVRGFVEGALFGKEAMDEEIKKLTLEFMR